MPRFACSTDGSRIAYETLGTGKPALVLVHGWSCDRHYWDAQLAPLARDFKVVTIDLAGHGESDRGRKTWSIASFGCDVAAVVDHLALDDTVLVGHSMGGIAILEAARRLAGRVHGLVWVDVYGDLPPARSEAQVRDRMRPFRSGFIAATREFVRSMFGLTADPLLVTRIAEDMAAAPPEVALAALEATWAFGRFVQALLAELRLPLVAINPDDSATNVEAMNRLGIDVVLLPGTGHFPMLEAPRAFNEQLAAAAKRIARSPKTRRDACG